MTYLGQHAAHASSGTVSEKHVVSVQVPFGQSPSLPLLRCRKTGVVRSVRRYYGTVRLPLAVHHRRASLDFPMRPTAVSALGGQRLSRFSRKVFPCMHGVSDRAGFSDSLPWRWRGCGLPRTSTASAPRSEVLSRLNTQPARTPVNASTPPLRATPHDSGPVWLARPLLCDSFIHNTLPVKPGARRAGHEHTGDAEGHR